MPRGVMAIAETKDEAEEQVLASAPNFRVLRSRRMDLSGLPPLRGGPLPTHWVVVVEHEDPAEEAKLPQDDDPDLKPERETRQMYLAMATDPSLLVTGVIEELDCPRCNARIKASLPPPREAMDGDHVTCDNCRAPLVRPRGAHEWEVIPKEPYPQCVFCGAQADSREHVVPRWISNRLGIKVFLSAQDAFVVGGSARRQEISFASYRARIMCAGCNTHFKHLEDSVIPLIVPMARGRSVSLGHESQNLLALWANKTAIALMAAADELRDVVPEGHARAVRDGRVADDTWVAYLPWRGSPIIATGEAVASDRHSQPTGPRHYAAILTFANLGVYVTGFTESLAREALAADREPLRQFWPPRDPLIHWPPSTAATRADLPGLLNLVPLRGA